MHRPKAWEPFPTEIEEIQQIGRYVDSLKVAIAQEKNRLRAEVENEFVVSAINAHITYLNQQIVMLQARMRSVVKANEILKQAADILCTIIGVGEATAYTFLGEIGLGEQFQSTRQVEAYCGMNPQLRQSGVSVNRRARLSKMGNVRMRRSLYMPAVAALKHNPVMQELYERLKGAGKHPKVILGAIMRKLLRIMVAVLRTKRAYILPTTSHCAAALTNRP